MTENKFSRRYEVKFKEMLFLDAPVMGEYVATKILCEIMLWKEEPEENEVRFSTQIREQLQYGAQHGNFLESHQRSFVFEATDHFDVSRLQEFCKKSATIASV